MQSTGKSNLLVDAAAIRGSPLKCFSRSSAAASPLISRLSLVPTTSSFRAMKLDFHARSRDDRDSSSGHERASYVTRYPPRRAPRSGPHSARQSNSIARVATMRRPLESTTRGANGCFWKALGVIKYAHNGSEGTTSLLLPSILKDAQQGNLA